MTATKSNNPPVQHESFEICIGDTTVTVAVSHRDGPLAPILFLHGFGGSKEDYLDIAINPLFRDRAFVAFDAPGCGRTTISKYSEISIPFLVKTTRAVLERLNIQRFHLVGHSMGGLAGLELAAESPESVLSFVNIKGNLAPEDCFLSRQIFTSADADSDKFLKNFVTRNYNSPYFSAPLYASTVEYKVRAAAVRGIFESMVHLSDNEDLLSKFLSLPCPRMFMFGEQYNTLSYLPTLKANHVQLAEIAHCGHFPMYSDPILMWKYIAGVVSSGDAQSSKQLS
ncbi:hypothetical protein NQ176_g3892 [Zarea fungicola]|uniref:Uncharacterized protein n=1 Tax=Zarea fungicola TaxID=93591 RepID=A0ACC1NI76_9HYPO|nr:hypothetical protein NQ176_g3892 [Lecanicillium fungicola]